MPDFRTTPTDNPRQRRIVYRSTTREAVFSLAKNQFLYTQHITQQCALSLWCPLPSVCIGRTFRRRDICASVVAVTFCFNLIHFFSSQAFNCVLYWSFTPCTGQASSCSVIRVSCVIGFTLLCHFHCSLFANIKWTSGCPFRSKSYLNHFQHYRCQHQPAKRIDSITTRSTAPNVMMVIFRQIIFHQRWPRPHRGICLIPATFSNVCVCSAQCTNCFVFNNPKHINTPRQPLQCCYFKQLLRSKGVEGAERQIR